MIHRASPKSHWACPGAAKADETDPSEYTLTVNADMEIKADGAGYWSDETASLEVTATITNWDELALDGSLLAASLLAAVSCSQNGQTVGECGETIAFTPPSNGGRVVSLLTSPVRRTAVADGRSGRDHRAAVQQLAVGANVVGQPAKS